MLPAFNNSSIYYAMENQPANLDATSSSWRGPQGATIGAFSCPSRGHSIARNKLVLDGEPKIWEGAEHATQHFLESVEAEVWLRAAIDVDNAIGRE
jgi:hypothetical protein